MRNQQGQAMVEFVLVLTIVLGMIFGIVSFFLLGISEEMLNNSAFVAARAASVGKSENEAKAAAYLSAAPILPFCRRSPGEIWGNTAELQLALNTVKTLAGDPSGLTAQGIDWSYRVVKQQFHQALQSGVSGNIYSRLDQQISDLNNIPYIGDLLYDYTKEKMKKSLGQIEYQIEGIIDPEIEKVFAEAKTVLIPYSRQLYNKSILPQYQQFFQQAQNYINLAVNFRSVPHLKVSVNRYSRGEWSNRTRMVYSRIGGMINCFGGTEVTVTGRMMDETNNLVIYNPLIMASGLAQISSWEEAKSVIVGFYHTFLKK